MKMSSKSRSEIVKTTIRIPKQLHTQMKEAINNTSESVETFLAKSIANELSARGYGRVSIPSTWDPLMAQRFLEFLPTPVVIKDTYARIVWCNSRYEDLLGRTRNQLLGSRIDELGVVDGASAARLRRDFQAITKAGGEKAEFWEPVTMSANGGQTTIFRAHRFLFKADKALLGKSVPFIGDISFDWYQVRPGLRRESDAGLLKTLHAAQVHRDLTALFGPFLQECPAALAIKSRDAWSCPRI